MKMLPVLLTVLLSQLFLSCSGGIPSLNPKGYVVSPEYLRGYSGGGSLSTLWYHGSDDRYHYFSHLVKTVTRYRVRRSELELEPGVEFAYGSQNSVLASSMLRRLVLDPYQE